MRKDEVDRHRVKRLAIPRREIFCSLILGKVKDFHIVKGLPKDFVVQEVNYDYLTRCFVFIIQHESFPVVEEGAIIPEMDDNFLIQMEYELYDPDEAMR